MLCDCFSSEQTADVVSGTIPSGEDEGERPGALKRISAMWSSFRRKRDSESNILIVFDVVILLSSLFSTQHARTFHGEIICVEGFRPFQ